MKKIGIIGGLGPESTVAYYRGIIDAFTPTYKTIGYPEISIESLDLKSFMTLIEASAWDEMAGTIADRCNLLEQGGAEIGAIASNTPHKVFEQIQSMTALPLISIVDAVCRHVVGRRHRCLGLLGTQLTMTSDFYQQAFDRHGIRCVTPSPEDQAYIQHKLFTEIEFGIIEESTKEKLLTIIEGLRQDHRIDGVILGCTELPLIIRPDDIRTDYVNSTDIHISAIVNQCRTGSTV